MDTEQEELQFLGFFGIVKDSFKIFYSCRKIFGQIALVLILPFSFIFLANIQISELLFFKILDNQDTLDHTQVGSPNYAKLSDIISSEWTSFWLFKVAYFTFLLILSLLSTSAVVYTYGYIYTGMEISFKKVMSVVPKVWKRLMVTFLWSFATVFVYNIIAGGLVILDLAFIGPAPLVSIVILVILLILYLAGFVYIGMVWLLASMVSVLEDVYEIKATIKSKDLIKGKMGLAIAIFFLPSTCFVVIEAIFKNFVVLGLVPDLGIRIGTGILSYFSMFKVILSGHMIQTVIYFVCKSYHHENINKSSLADHLDVYLGEYVPFKAKDVQLEQYHV